MIQNNLYLWVMDELKQFANNIAYLNSNWKTISDKFFNSFEPDFIDMIQGQLLRGKDGEGNDLLAYASQVYANYKKGIGSISSPIADLRNEGDFYDGMFMDKFSEIDSTDWKAGALFNKYGDSILDPQPDNLNKFIADQIVPELEALILTELTK